MVIFQEILPILTSLNFLIVTTLSIVFLILIKRFIDGPSYNIPDINLKGKTAVVTGGNCGIGFQTVKQLALLGCQVTIGARNRKKAEKCIKDIKNIDSSASVEFIPLDLAEKQSVEAFVSCLKSTKIDYLVNNAGVMGIPVRKITKEGAEMQWGINHLGHFYLTCLLWPKIKQSQFFRIVNVSSFGHKKYLGFFQNVKVDFENINFNHDYDPHMAYSRSKMYNVLFTKALAEKIDSKKGIVVSLNPGVVRTDIIREMIGNGIKGLLLSFALKVFWPFWCFFTKSSKQGASTSLFALLSSNVQNGCYYSDCQQSEVNSDIVPHNWKKIWEISQSYLKIRFCPEDSNN